MTDYQFWLTIGIVTMLLMALAFVPGRRRERNAGDRSHDQRGHWLVLIGCLLLAGCGDADDRPHGVVAEKRFEYPDRYYVTIEYLGQQQTKLVPSFEYKDRYVGQDVPLILEK